MAFIVIDKNGRAWGTFTHAFLAAAWAVKKWPDEEEDSEREEFAGRGWVVIPMHHPSL